MPVVVLEALAGQRRAPGGGAHQEAATARVPERPHLVAGPLEPEHRVEDVERDHRQAVRRVGRAGRLEAGHRARLGDPLLEDLAVGRLAIGEDEVRVDRRVALPERRVDPDLLEQRVHAEGARLVRDDRHDPRPELRIADQVAQDPGEDHRRRDRRRAAGRELGIDRGGRSRQRRRSHDPARQRPAQRAASLDEVLDLLGIRARVVVRRVLEGLVRDRQLEAVAEDPELGLVELLGLVGDVAGLDPGPERPALDRVGEDHRRGAGVLGGGLVGGVHLAVVVAAAAELGQVVVGQVLDQLLEPRVGPEEVLADVGAAGDRELLELTVERLVHLLDEQPVHVAREQVVPLAAPDDLDHVPAGAAERGLELLDDLAVAADRAVEPLQVAVDDEGQVVETLARRDVQRAERFGLVGLAVAEEGPDPRVRRYRAGRGCWR